MLKISGPVGAAFASVFLLSAAGPGLSIESARADDCLAAPKAAAPNGQHWYYHIDRATRRKCWYLHAAGVLHHHAAIRHHATDAAADADPAAASQNAAVSQPAAEPQTAAAPEPPAAPVASPTLPPPAPDSAASNAPPAPHVTVLAVRPSTPFVSSAPAPQQITPQQAPTPPAPQTLPREEGTPAMDGAKPPDTADAAPPQDKAEAADGAPQQTADAAAVDARTRTAEMFILLALVFGVAAAVIAIVSKILGIYRRPIISDDPDAAWLSYRSARRRIDAQAQPDEQGVPYLDPQEHYGLADLHAQEWLDRSTPAQDEPPASSRQNGDFVQPQSGPNLKGIEPALRALRQARQS